MIKLIKTVIKDLKEWVKFLLFIPVLLAYLIVSTVTVSTGWKCSEKLEQKMIPLLRRLSS
jgi:hypothetical protein